MRTWEYYGYDIPDDDVYFFIVSCGDEDIYCETQETAEAVATALNLQEKIISGRN